MTRTVTAGAETWPLAHPFKIARGTRTDIHIVVVEISEGGLTGRGECFPHERYGHSPDTVLADIQTISRELEQGLTRSDLLDRLPAGPSRNAIDSALWDLEAKLSNTPVWTRVGLSAPPDLVTVMTIGLDDPEVMAVKTRKAVQAGHERLKVKLGSRDGRDSDRILAVRKQAPDAQIIVDANEGWNVEMLQATLPALLDANIVMIEQPLPAKDDEALRTMPHPVPIGADESVHSRADLAGLVGKYDVINIKLDKSGGLTEALALAEAARGAGFKLMVGCMIGTSLAMTPAMILAAQADYVDLDGPLWLKTDRGPGIESNSGQMIWPKGGWGEP